MYLHHDLVKGVSSNVSLSSTSIPRHPSFCYTKQRKNRMGRAVNLHSKTHVSCQVKRDNDLSTFGVSSGFSLSRVAAIYFIHLVEEESSFPFFLSKHSFIVLLPGIFFNTLSRRSGINVSPLDRVTHWLLRGTNQSGPGIDTWRLPFHSKWSSISGIQR